MAHPILTRAEAAEVCPWLADPDWVDPVDIGAQLSYDPDPPAATLDDASQVYVTGTYRGWKVFCFRLKIEAAVWRRAQEEGYRADRDRLCQQFKAKIPRRRRPARINWEQIHWSRLAYGVDEAA